MLLFDTFAKSADIPQRRFPNFFPTCRVANIFRAQSRFAEPILPGTHCVLCPVSHLSQEQLVHHIERLECKREDEHANLLRFYLKLKFGEVELNIQGFIDRYTPTEPEELVRYNDALELERKSFVRDYSLRAERHRQNYKPRKSKEPHIAADSQSDA